MSSIFQDYYSHTGTIQIHANHPMDLKTQSVSDVYQKLPRNVAIYRIFVYGKTPDRNYSLTTSHHDIVSNDKPIAIHCSSRQTSSDSLLERCFLDEIQDTNTSGENCTGLSCRSMTTCICVMSALPSDQNGLRNQYLSDPVQHINKR